MTFPESTVCRIVPLKFSGLEMQFKLSHALFSSRKIDDGTMLLLKTIAQQNVVPSVGRIIDSGCGVGPLAVALKKKNPALRVCAQDRFALAVEYTRENARLNRVELDVRCGLLLRDVEGPWDLIVSNVPAKAGEPVLVDFFERSLDQLAPGGTAAIVIVSTLASWAEETLERLGARIGFKESTREYCVFHYQKPPQSAFAEKTIVEAYRRSKGSWPMKNQDLSVSTFWGLPNFDSLDYQLQVTLSLVDKMTWKPSCLVVEPGQGHVPTTLAQLFSVRPHLASCDVLSLCASESNVTSKGYSVSGTTLFSHPNTLLELPSGRFESAVVCLQTTAEIPWVEETQTALRHLLAPGASLVVSGTSTDLARFLEKRKNFVVQRDLKYRGFRAVGFEYRPSP